MREIGAITQDVNNTRRYYSKVNNCVNAGALLLKRGIVINAAHGVITNVTPDRYRPLILKLIFPIRYTVNYCNRAVNKGLFLAANLCDASNFNNSRVHAAIYTKPPNIIILFQTHRRKYSEDKEETRMCT